MKRVRSGKAAVEPEAADAVLMAEVAGADAADMAAAEAGAEGDAEDTAEADATADFFTTNFDPQWGASRI